MNKIKAKRITGFTLIEMIIVILIVGILSSIMFTVLRGPMQAFVDAEKRTRLIDIADTALQRMTREIRLALPNSIRVGGTTIEFLRTLEGGRYRAFSDGASVVCGGASAAVLDFSMPADCFEVMGSLINFASIDTTGPGTCLDSGLDCLAIYNTGQLDADAYSDDNLADITGATANSINFVGAPPFPFRSPRQRFFIVDTPVSFICNGGSINRFDDYTIGGAVGVGNLLVNQVSACNFTYNPGSARRAGLVTLSITIQDATLGGGSVTLLQQAHVDNQP